MGQKRLAIIGGGSSGLICLKYALDELPDWEVVCFEKTSEVTGCWGRPPRGFVSTSTKYTTQFACHRLYDATVAAGGGRDDDPTESHREFFRDDEFGRYLESFAAKFQLDRQIARNCQVTRISRRDDGDWELALVRGDQESLERFSAVVVCTGLADQPRPVEDCPIPTLRSLDAAAEITGKRIVVMGGGESAVDMAQRLCRADLRNQVYLSLRSGIRVSPRYHPIRGVPSDFLRNRLLLSIHPDIRNWIGQRFVEFRIRSEAWLRRLFPAATRPPRAGQLATDPGAAGQRAAGQRATGQTASGEPTRHDAAAAAKRKFWDLKLTRAAKAQLFNMYHNKSDDFLDSVAAGRIAIVGANVDRDYRDYFEFDSRESLSVDPDLIVPAIGYRSTLSEISGGEVALEDFYLGCAHARYENLHLVGFTRPIIGNIPSISEMQARYVCGLISGRFARPPGLAEQHRVDRQKLAESYSRLDTVNVYPVEMFPYCDRLARLMDCYPTRRRAGSLTRWWRMMLAPATTMHYFETHLASSSAAQPPIHAPLGITLLLLLIKPFDAMYRLCRRD